MGSIKKFNFWFNCEHPEVFVTSQWQRNFNPSVKFLVYRWIFAAYFNFVLILSVITAEQCNQARYYLIYLTNWNVIMNALSSLIGAVLTTLHRKNYEPDGTQEMTFMLKLYWLLATLSTVVSISLSCVYWPLIYDGRDKGLNDSLTHAGNAIFMLIDVFINAHPPRFGHFIYHLGFGILYAYIFSISYIMLGGTDRDSNNYIYSVVDWKNNTIGAFTFATLTIIFLIAIHFIITRLAHLKIYLHSLWMQRITNNQNSNCEANDNLSFNCT